MSRRGRPRKPGPRTPNGQLQRDSRQERRENMQSTALEARARQFGMAPKDVPPDIETNVLGRLRATGEISPRQHEAGTIYRRIVAVYDRAHLAKGVPKAGDMDRSGGFDGIDPFHPEFREAWEADHAKAVRRYDECEAALQQANVEDRHASYTVKAVVIADWAVDYFTPALRVGLNALAHVLQLPLDPPKEAAA